MSKIKPKNIKSPTVLKNKNKKKLTPNCYQKYQFGFTDIHPPVGKEKEFSRVVLR